MSVFDFINFFLRNRNNNKNYRIGIKVEYVVICHLICTSKNIVFHLSKQVNSMINMLWILDLQ